MEYQSKLGNQKGTLPPLILLAALGLLGFFLVAASFSFTKNPFKVLFPKPASKATSEIIFLDNSGNLITNTTSATVNLDLFAPWPNQQSSTTPTPTPDPNNLKTTFILSTSNTQIVDGSQFQVKVLARSENEEANLFSAKLNYDKDKIEVLSIDPTNSFVGAAFRIFNYDNNIGDLFLIGGIPSPGYKTSGTDSELATVVFRAKQIGNAFLNFNPSSGIYSNVTNQNILETPSNLNFNITASSLSPTPTSTPTIAPSPTPTSSPTPAPTNCKFTEAKWDSQFNPIREGNLVRMRVKGSGSCDNKKVKFKVVEDDPVGADDDAKNVAAAGTFTNNEAISTWVAEYQIDGIFNIAAPPEYYFKADLENSTESTQSAMPNLTVVKIGSNEYLKGDGDHNKVIDDGDHSKLMSWINLTPEIRIGFPTEIDINDDGVINIPDYSGLLLILKVNNVLGYRQLFTERATSQDIAFNLIPNAFAQVVKYTITVTLAEDSNFTQNAVTLSYNSHPFRTTYTFSDLSLGTKTLFARFTASDGEIQDFSATVELRSPATLSLIPNTGTLNRGCNYSLDIEVDTGGAETAGTDAVLFYDNTRLTPTSITNGSIYPSYPGNIINSSNIMVSGLALPPPAIGIKGKGILATINFSVPSSAPVGNSSLNFDFDPNNKSKTADSNIVENMTIVDLLSSVTNGNYAVGIGSCTNASFKRVFISSQLFDGNLGGLTGADQICQNMATSASLGGVWKAWLSSTTVSVSSRLNQSTLSYKLENGGVIANNWGDLTDGSILNLINIDENSNVINNQAVWTNTKPDGSSADTSKLSNTCQDWTSNSLSDKATAGDSGKLSGNWTDDNSVSCDTTNRIYCIEQ